MAALPLSINQLQGTRSNAVNKLEWLISCGSSPSATVVLERSRDGITFETISTQTATAARCASPFYFTDTHVEAGNNYYRIKTLSADGRMTLTNVVLLQHNTTGCNC